MARTVTRKETSAWHLSTDVFQYSKHWSVLPGLHYNVFFLGFLRGINPGTFQITISIKRA